MSEGTFEKGNLKKGKLQSKEFEELKVSDSNGALGGKDIAKKSLGSSNAGFQGQGELKAPKNIKHQAEFGEKNIAANEALGSGNFGFQENQDLKAPIGRKSQVEFGESNNLGFQEPKELKAPRSMKNGGFAAMDKGNSGILGEDDFGLQGSGGFKMPGNMGKLPGFGIEDALGGFVGNQGLGFKRPKGLKVPSGIGVFGGRVPGNFLGGQGFGELQGFGGFRGLDIPEGINAFGFEDIFGFGDFPMGGFQFPEFDEFDMPNTVAPGDVLAYDNLLVDNFTFEYLKEVRIANDINNHGVLELVGVVPTEIADSDVYYTDECTPIELFYLDTNYEKKTVFNGMVTKVRVKAEKDVHLLYIKALSHTSQMDIEKRSRSFQNINLTSHQLIKDIISEYGDADVILNIPNEPIGEFLLQYRETDWEFIKRVTSRYNQGLFPEVQADKIRFFVGCPENFENETLEVKNYSVNKDLQLYEEMKKNYLKDANEIDYVIYEVKSPKVLKLGSSIKFKNLSFYISEVSSELKEGILRNTYKLQNKNGLRQKRLYNHDLIGISINGEILGVKRDRVKVQLDIDEKQDKENAYWFPYATVSASPDGGGWYCMPKVGEKIRLNCPIKDEKKAFVINAIDSHEADQVDENDRMSNPDNKSLQTDSGQEVKFTPSGVLIESSGSQAKINLNKDGTMEVTGQKNVYITCAQNLSIRAEKEISISGNKNIDILCESGSSLVIPESDEISVKAVRVHNNG
ncbi:MAG: contractile injection system protein, VgrG/Pvc8 family [Clostridiaceae bacterium]